MFKILTKRILTCLKKVLFAILVQNSPKVTKKVLVFQKKNARSYTLTEKLLKILKVAKKLLSRIWKEGHTVMGGVQSQEVPSHGRCPVVSGTQS